MPTSAVETRALARHVTTTDDTLTVDLADGRSITVPLVWFPRLVHAEPKARDTWEILGDGEGIHWPMADEDLSVEGLLTGYRGT
jgi:hypothetical protein